MFSFACDESCDIHDTAHLAVCCRYVNLHGPQEEIVALLPLRGQTRGEDIESAVTNFFKSKGIDLNKIASIARDGCPSMVAHRKGFVTRLKKLVNHEVISLHCIIHQEALCAQTLPNELTEVMNLVVKIVNKIMARGLNHRQFCNLLEELNHQYSDLLMHNKIRWLSRGNVLKRFTSSIEEVKLWLFEKGVEYTELTDPEWLQKLFFMVDLFNHFNELNRKLQGKGIAAVFLLEEVIAFERKFMLFQKDICTGKLLHFPTFKQYSEEMSFEIDTKVFSETVAQIERNFSLRFHDFRKEKDTLKFVINPLETDTNTMNYSPFPGVDIAQFELQLEDLKAKDVWIDKFKELATDLQNLEKEKSKLALQHRWTEIEELSQQEKMLIQVWNGLPESYGELKKVAFGVLSVFGSTYLCDQLFSHMTYLKSKYRNKMSDETLESCLKMKTSGYSPDIKQLAENMQRQKSH